MQRMVMLTSILAVAGNRGRPALELADSVGFAGQPDSRREQLGRLIRTLQGVGVVIENTSPPGAEAHWVLRPGDSRIRLALSAAEQSELARAALLADRRQLADQLGLPTGTQPSLDISVAALPVDVDQVLGAVTSRAALHFSYNGKPRLLDPASLQREADAWAVSGVERDSGEYRTFYLARMTAVRVGAPASARDVADAPRSGSDPLTWQVDPPTPAVVTVVDGFDADVRRLLGDPQSQDARGWHFVVTNRWVFFARLIELKERVILTGSTELRQAWADRLREVL